MRIRLGVVVLALATVFSGVTAASAHPSHSPTVVATTGGVLRGVATETGTQFLGVPYAAPPVGPLRWQPPQPAKRWWGIRDASRFGPHCAQSASPFGEASTAEDCLYLNVYTPSRRAPGSPVMLWIHGGAMVSGASNQFDPTPLVREGIVVVTINYRLGALGFLAHPTLSSGNFGLMDQQAALRWVHRNITRFGGDPGNVTLAGLSAGGLSVLAHMVSPAVRGMFDRAIVQSGAYGLTLPSRADANAEGQSFAAATGCADAACLRELPVTTVLAHQKAAYDPPHVDGRVLPQSLDTAFTRGQFARVPIINGSTHDEWRLYVGAGELAGQPVTEANYQPMIAATLGVPPEAAATIATQYPLTAYPSPAEALGAVGTDAIFACPALTLSTLVSKFVPTYGYEFNDPNAPGLLPPVSFPYGASHGSELQYLFQFPTTGSLTPDQQRLASTMRQYWTTFTARGTPGAPRWPRFDNTTQRVQSLVPPQPQAETDFATAHKCGFWSAGTAGR